MKHRQQANQGNFSFPSFSSRPEPRIHKVSLEPHCEATIKDPDPKKIPRASFGLLNLCAKFQDHILTGSTSNRGTIRSPRFHVWACLHQTLSLRFAFVPDYQFAVDDNANKRPTQTYNKIEITNKCKKVNDKKCFSKKLSKFIFHALYLKICLVCFQSQDLKKTFFLLDK